MSRVDSLNQEDDPFRAVVAGLERLKTAIVDETDDGRLIEITEELWDVVDAAEAVLETIDFEELPDTVDLEALPDAVEIETIPDAIATGDAGESIDLSKLKDAIELRELWEAVDLVALRSAEHDLELEITDVIDTDAVGTSDDGGSGGFSELVSGGAHVQFDVSPVRKRFSARPKAPLRRSGRPCSKRMGRFGRSTNPIKHRLGHRIDAPPRARWFTRRSRRGRSRTRRRPGIRACLRRFATRERETHGGSTADGSSALLVGRGGSKIGPGVAAALVGC